MYARHGVVLGPAKVCSRISSSDVSSGGGDGGGSAGSSSSSSIRSVTGQKNMHVAQGTSWCFGS